MCSCSYFNTDLGNSMHLVPGRTSSHCCHGRGDWRILSLGLGSCRQKEGIRRAEPPCSTTLKVIKLFPCMGPREAVVFLLEVLSYKREIICQHICQDLTWPWQEVLMAFDLVVGLVTRVGRGRKHSANWLLWAAQAHPSRRSQLSVSDSLCSISL